MKSLSFFSLTAASNLSNHFLPSSFSSVGSAQSLSLVQLFVKPWTAAHQVPLSITNTRSLLKLISIKSEMPSNHLIFCCPLLLLPSIFPSIRVFSNESALCIRCPKYLQLSCQSLQWIFRVDLLSSCMYTYIPSLLDRPSSAPSHASSSSQSIELSSLGFIVGSH